jgi:hypothetical protein
MTLTLESIESLAPDQSSLAAAVKLKTGVWPVLRRNASQGFAWGECQGSGATPYRVCIQVADMGYKCTCPSRKFPCKHSLALMLLLAKSGELFSEGAVPEWVNEWASRRRGPGARSEDTSEPSKKSLDAAIAAAPEAPPDPEQAAATAAKAQKQREHLREQREASILSGLDELDTWLADCLRRGLANFMQDATHTCRTLAKRLVDAKAPGLANTIDSLPSRIYALPDALRERALLEALGSLHLLAEAYRRQSALPESLQNDVRRLLGWTTERQALIEDKDALRVRGAWTVLGSFSEVQPDKLRRIETWLIGDEQTSAQPALLLDYVPVATGSKGSALRAGEVFDAELLFYRSAVPLRAVVVEKTAREMADPVTAEAGVPLADAMAHYDEMRAAQPWLGQYPFTLKRVTCVMRGREALFVREAGETAVTAATVALPVEPRIADAAIVLTGVDIGSLSGLWDGSFFTPLSANTNLGVWTLT